MERGMMIGWINERDMILYQCSSRKYMVESIERYINTTLPHCIFHTNYDSAKILSSHKFIRQSYGGVSRGEFPDTLCM
jgi:hypothetical protein